MSIAARVGAIYRRIENLETDETAQQRHVDECKVRLDEAEAAYDLACQALATTRDALDEARLDLIAAAGGSVDGGSVVTVGETAPDPAKKAEAEQRIKHFAEFLSDFNGPAAPKKPARKAAAAKKATRKK